MMEAQKPVWSHGGQPVLYVTLDFHCCICHGPVCVTLRCEGEGMAGEAARTVASLNIPCPHCSDVNELFFEPCGQIRGVRPWKGRPAIPTPSLN